MTHEIGAAKNPKKEIAKQLILTAISDRKFMVGWPLSESQIEKVVNAYLPANEALSLTPIRQAIAMLSDDRLLKVIPQKGTFVRPITFRDVKEIQKSRMVFECYCVRKAIRIRSSLVSELEKLNSVLAGGDASKKPHLIEYVNNDFAFHAQIIKASGYDLTFGKLLSSIQSRFTLIAIPNAERFSAINSKEHTEIIHAIKNRSVDSATKAMQTHLWNAAKRWRKSALR